MLLLTFFLGPGSADLHILYVHLLVASPFSLFSALYLAAHSTFFFPWCFLLWVFSALLVLSDALFLLFVLSARFMLLGSFLCGFVFC
jgi:hypothetical protein